MKHSGWQYVGIKAINPESSLPYLGQELPALLLGRRSPGRAGYPSAKATSLPWNGDAGAHTHLSRLVLQLFFLPKGSGKHLQWAGVCEPTPETHGHQNTAKWHKSVTGVWGGNEEKVLQAEGG